MGTGAVCVWVCDKWRYRCTLTLYQWCCSFSAFFGKWDRIWNFHSVLWHCWFGNRTGIQPVKKLGVGLLVAMIWLAYSSSCHHRFNHPLLQWTPANPGSPGRWPLKRRERERRQNLKTESEIRSATRWITWHRAKGVHVNMHVSRASNMSMQCMDTFMEMGTSDDPSENGLACSRCIIAKGWAYRMRQLS